jgi:hypothetical protein
MSKKVSLVCCVRNLAFNFGFMKIIFRMEKVHAQSRLILSETLHVWRRREKQNAWLM